MPCGYHDRSDTFSLVAANGSLVHAATGYCLTVVSAAAAARPQRVVVLRECGTTTSNDTDRATQRWTFVPPELANAIAVDVSDSDKPVGRLVLEEGDDTGERVCLSQMTIDRNGQQGAGLLMCDTANSLDKRFTYWAFSYRLNWSVLNT